MSLMVLRLPVLGAIFRGLGRLPSVLLDGVLLFYQRYLSPRKGFCCAYRLHTGRWSCSGYARRMNRKRGVLAVLSGMRRQFARCHAAHLALHSAQEERNKKQSQLAEESVDCCLNAACEVAPDIACNTTRGLTKGLLKTDCDCLPCDCSP